MFQSLFKDYNLSDYLSISMLHTELIRFNPSSRITTFRTGGQGDPLQLALRSFNPSSRITTFRTQMRAGFSFGWRRVSTPLQGLQPFGQAGDSLWTIARSFGFQSLFKDYNLSDLAQENLPRPSIAWFQSLFKDYNLSDPSLPVMPIGSSLLFQSLFKDYNLSDVTFQSTW